MPHSQYVAGREPPSLGDRVLAHPFIIPMGIFAALAAVMIGISQFTGWEVSRSLARMETWTAMIIGGLLAVGAPVSIWGAMNPGWRYSQRRAMEIERIGCTALSAAWLAYGVSVILTGNPFGGIAAWLGCGVGISYLLRGVALWVSEKRILARAEAERRLRE